MGIFHGDMGIFLKKNIVTHSDMWYMKIKNKNIGEQKFKTPNWHMFANFSKTMSTVIFILCLCTCNLILCEWQSTHEKLSRCHMCERYTECVGSIKGKQMGLVTLTQRFPEPLLRNLCSDWPSGPNRRPRRSQSERALNFDHLPLP